MSTLRFTDAAGRPSFVDRAEFSADYEADSTLVRVSAKGSGEGGLSLFLTPAEASELCAQIMASVHAHRLQSGKVKPKTQRIAHTKAAPTIAHPKPRPAHKPLLGGLGTIPGAVGLADLVPIRRVR